MMGERPGSLRNPSAGERGGAEVDKSKADTGARATRWVSRCEESSLGCVDTAELAVGSR